MPLTYGRALALRPMIESTEGRRERLSPFSSLEKSGRTSHWSSVGGRRLWRGHNSGKVGGHGHSFGATVATVAKRKPASTVSDQQSDRQPSAGASRATGS